MAAKRLSRKEILKEDPFQVALQGTMEALIANKTAILIGFVAVAIVAGLFALWQNYSSKSEVEAQYQLAKGLDTFHAVVRNATDPATSPPSDPLNPPSEFKTDTEKYTEALKRFQETAAKYPSKQAGLMAEYYVGLCQQRLDQTDAAIKTIARVSNRFKEPTYNSVAKSTLAELYEAKGRYDEAAKLDKELLDDKSSHLPKDEILMALGRCYEGLNKKDEAIKTYERVGQEYPTSLYLSNANQRLVKLGGKPVQPPAAPGQPGLGGLPFNVE